MSKRTLILKPFDSFSGPLGLFQHSFDTPGREAQENLFETFCGASQHHHIRCQRVEQSGQDGEGQTTEITLCSFAWSPKTHGFPDVAYKKWFVAETGTPVYGGSDRKK